MRVPIKYSKEDSRFALDETRVIRELNDILDCYKLGAVEIPPPEVIESIENNKEAQEEEA